jgi:hypothetical protein
VLICGDCSARNNDGESFCGNCGAYLVWQRPHAAAEEQRPTLSARSATGPSPAVTTVPIPVVPAPPGNAPGSPPGTLPGTPPGSPPGALPGERRNSARESHPTRGAHMAGSTRREAPGNTGIRETADPTGHGAGPVEVKPGHRTVPVPNQAPLPDEPAPLPGELICGRCGAGNKPERNFCRRCAASLREAAVVPPLPWWRRFLSRRQRGALPAGTRPKRRKQRRFPTRSVSFLAVVGLFGGAAYLGQGAIAAAVVRVQDNLQSGPLHAQSITASSSAPDRGPDLAIDGTRDRSWAAAAPGTGNGETLEARFEKPWRLTYVFIRGGASEATEAWNKERRPVRVEIITKRQDGEPTTLLPVDLQDVTGPQRFYVGADEVSTVTFKILESTGPPDARVSVAELQFFGR